MRIEERLVIAMDEMTSHIGDVIPAPPRQPGTTVRVQAAEERRHRSAFAPVMGIAAALIVGLLVIVPLVRQKADSPVTSTSAAPSDGRLIPDPLPANWRVESAWDLRPEAGSDAFKVRVYTTMSQTPERDVAFVLTAIRDGEGTPVIGDNPEPVTIQGTQGQVFAFGGKGEKVVFGPVGGYQYSLVGYNARRDQLVAAAAVVRPATDGYGGVIDPVGLPAGVLERAEGLNSNQFFLTRQAVERPIREVHWTDGIRTVWYFSLEQAPELLTTERLGFDSISETMVQNHPGFLAVAEDGQLRTLAWHNGTHTILLGSSGLTNDELMSFAASLRPATTQEWSSVLAA